MNRIYQYLRKIMKTTYYTTSSNTLIPIKPPRRLECIIIRNYPTKYSKAFKAFKEFLDGTSHITKYCKIKYEKSTRNTDLGRWNLCNVKPENVYVFPYRIEYLRFLGLLTSMRLKNDILKAYTVFPTFYLKSDNTDPLEYYCGFGNLLIDEHNLKYIKED